MEKSKIYFVGGAKGVGKSTLLDQVSGKTGLDVVNTGDFFKGDKSPSDIKREILDYLIGNSPLIADTHYAGFIGGIFSGKFERGLYDFELQRLHENSDLDLILVDLTLPELIKRRNSELKNIRDQNVENMGLELEHNRRYFQEYCSQLNKAGQIIYNHNLASSYDQLLNILSEQS